MKKIIFWVIILVIATVPIFRAFWMLLDNIDWLNEPAGIFVSFAAGVMAAIWALVRINSKIP
ncbi:MAG TPA: hypothetical protein ENN79_07360 [Desulfobacteraceae bacterium]|nr:hypothetical protein [Desulfobacteraceae bacterium]